MEKRINKKIDNWRTTFKNDIIKHIQQNKNNKNFVRNIEEYIINYQSIIIDKTDLTKRKRIKILYFCDKCCALRANGEQCSRRRKPNEKFSEHILKVFHTVKLIMNHQKKHIKKFKFGFKKYMVLIITLIIKTMYIIITISLIIKQILNQLFYYSKTLMVNILIPILINNLY